MFNTKKQGYGFGAMPGFNNRKIGSLSNGDYDRDGVKNKKDCDAFNFKKQDGGEQFVEWTREDLEEERRLKGQRESSSRMRSDVDLKVANMGHKGYAEAERKLAGLYKRKQRGN